MQPSIKGNTNFNQDVRNLAKAQDKKENGPMGQQVSELAHQKKTHNVDQPVSVVNKKQLNAAILESSLKFNETISNQPLSLLLKTALEGINDALKELGVETTVEKAYESGIDVSPEATAERIVTFSTQFFSSYQEQNPELDPEQALTKFIEVIGGGIEQGFSEARDVLGGLNVLEGDIATNIDKTYELVLQGLQDFVDLNTAQEEPNTAEKEEV